MPSTVNLHLIGVWFCVGFLTGAGVGGCHVARGTDHLLYLTWTSGSYCLGQGWRRTGPPRLFV